MMIVEVHIGSVIVGFLPFIAALCTLTGLLLVAQLELWLPSEMR